MVCLRPYLSLKVCTCNSLLDMFEVLDCHKLDQFIVLGGNNSDLADILSVLLMSETID